MKKIISTAIAATLIAGAAFAEVTVGLNARVRPYLFRLEAIDYNNKGAKANDESAYTKKTYADLDGYGVMSDTLKVSGKTDYAGVTGEFTINALGTAFAVDNYYGWLTFGGLNITGGVYDSRFTNRGNYSATEEGWLDKEFDKGLGLGQLHGNKGAANSRLKDFGNVAQIDGGNNLSFLFDYTFKDIAGGALLLKGGFVEDGSNFANDEGATGTIRHFTQSAGYVAEAAWRKDNLAAVDVIFKMPGRSDTTGNYNHKATNRIEDYLNWQAGKDGKYSHDENNSQFFGVGVYVTPLMIANTKNVVAGFTWGHQTGVLDYAYAVDLRAQYNIDSNMTFAIGAKYEAENYSDTYARLNNIDKSTEDKWYQNGANVGVTRYGVEHTAFQIGGEFSYKVNDIIMTAFDLGFKNSDLWDYDYNTHDGSQVLVASVRGKFTAGKNAALTTALRWTQTLNYLDDTGKTKFTFDIPVVLRVKM